MLVVHLTYGPGGFDPLAENKNLVEEVTVPAPPVAEPLEVLVAVLEEQDVITPDQAREILAVS